MADIQQGRQVVVDRLKRRLDNYRNHNNLNTHHFEATVDSIYSDQRKQTQVLKQRHIESKVKKTSKKTSENKKHDSPLLGSMGQSKLLARGHDQTSGHGDMQENEPAAKKQRLVNGSLVNSSVSADISDFQIVQQLRNIKSNSSPNPVASNNGGCSGSVPNPSGSTLPCPDPLEGLAESALVGNDSEDIKKETDLDIPNDSLLEDLGELGSFEDMDMGINLADFVHDLDLDNIKHENSNPGIDSYFKDEVGDALYDDPSTICSDNMSAVTSNSGGQFTQAGNKVTANTSTALSYPQYSNTPPVSHSSTPPSSFTATSYSSVPQSTYNSCITSSPSQNSSYPMSNSLPKMRMNVNNIPVGQSDMALAAQTLKHMAEQHQTKLSPTGTPVRSSLGEFGYNSMAAATPVMAQACSVPSQMYNNTLNQNSTLYNQSMGTDMEMKRRQHMMQQYSIQQMQHQPPGVSGHCNQQVTQSISQNVHTQPQSQTQQKPTQQTQQVQSQQNPSQLQQQQQQQVSQASQLQPQTSQSPQTQQQQQQLQHSPHQAQNQQSNQSPQLSNSMSPFSNRMSPMNSYPHASQASSQIGINTPYGPTMCGGMTPGLRGSYPTPTRGSSPIPTGPPSSMQTGNQPPRFMQQQMMGSVGMIRSQMMAQSGQMMTRPPPPEYRQAAMMQQHQGVLSQPMSQNMAQMHQNMSQMAYQNMRPGFRTNMGTNPMNTMASGQMMGNMNQQSIPANIPNMKGPVVSANNMNIPVTMSPSMVPGGGAMGGSGMPVTMNQVSGGGNIGIVNTRPAMMQRARSPNVNMAMSGLGMSTQMPPSRPEWRQMMMQQGQSGIIMGPGIRHGYQQTQQGPMMSQGGQMISMQRSQPHMMGMMGMQTGPGMQHSSNMNGGSTMQGNGNIAASMHNNPSVQPGMPVGQRLGQHGLTLSQQGQIRMGMQINPQGMSDSRSTGVMVQNQGGASGNMTQMGSTTGSIGHHGGVGVNVGLSQIGNNTNNVSNMNPMSQGGSNVAPVIPVSQSLNGGNMNAMNAHPRSPATMGQIHPCSPAGQSRPLSNPGLGLGTAQGQSGNCSQSVSGNSSPLMGCTTSQSSQNQLRPNMGGNIPSGRTSDPMSQVNQCHTNMGTQGQGSVPSNQQQCGGNSALQNSNNMLLNKGGSNAVNSISGGQRPDSRGAGGAGIKTSQPSTPNPPPSSSASNDFDLIFNNEGEFAALLH